MIFTGERSNTLKFFFALTVFFYFNDKIQLNHKILFAISVIIIFLGSYSQVNTLKHRYYNDLIEKLNDKESRQKFVFLFF